MKGIRQNNRSQTARLNTQTALLYQFAAIFCGWITPRLLLSAFGSEIYGATASIIQFLSYCTLLEGGIGGVARAALYTPLANRDTKEIGHIYFAVKRFLRVVGAICLAYTLLIACVYHNIADISFWERTDTFALVIVIGLSTLGQYFFGITNAVLLSADQKQYISNILSVVTTLVNTLLVALLIRLGCSILLVKLCTSCVYLVRPICLALYVQRRYHPVKPADADASVLRQKWTGLGQHIAYFLHTNTDVVLLTCFADLRLVSIYAVYHMIAASIRSVVRSFSAGMEALFGDMLAKKEYAALHRAYTQYETLLATVSTILFGTAAVLLVPFVKLYTKNITDVHYIYPLFGQILLLGEAIDCMAIPCYGLSVAANRFQQTKLGAYGEAALNILLSLVLMRWDPLLGVALGTLAAVLFKTVFYMRYVSGRLVQIRFNRSFGQLIVNILMLLLVTFLGNGIIGQIEIMSYAAWLACAVPALLGITGFVVLFRLLLAPRAYKSFLLSLPGRKGTF